MISHTAFQAFENRLLKMYKHRGKLARRQGISCFRVYDRDLNDFLFSIDWYEGHVYLSVYAKKYETIDEAFLQDCIRIISNVFQVPHEKIFLRERKKMDHIQEQYEKLNFENTFFPVHENGLQFLVNLTDYLDTGLFLDHRITRKMVMAQSEGKRVLNLFAYTGAFSVYAAAGNAESVTTVDLSNTYLNWAKNNFQLNQFSMQEKFSFIKADVIHYLSSLPPKSFDLIIMDPPTFSNSKAMKGFLDVREGHVSLINDALNALDQNGLLYFSTNSSRFRLLQEAIHSEKIEDITKQTTPFDFEGKLKRWCFRIGK
ncbi:MAG: class I SAM-dependent methyltransferase [Bacteroidetes bacterium]|nr:class I SAM-dependent methyltransferase [Bacteroidota bacterium]